MEELDGEEKSLAFTLGLPRFESVDQEMFSAKEEQESESSDDPLRGLGRWFKVVKPNKIGGLRNLGSPCYWRNNWSKLRLVCLKPNSCVSHAKYPGILRVLRMTWVCVPHNATCTCASSSRA